MPAHTLTKAQLISLIRDDLINYKLVSSLNDMGLSAHDYFLHLSETIFELMGCTENASDQVFEVYLEQLKKTRKLDIKNRAAFDRLATIIYKGLLAFIAESRLNKGS